MAYVVGSKVLWAPYALAPSEVATPQVDPNIRVFVFNTENEAQLFAALWS